MGPVILYEDRRSPSKRFGLHELAIYCVFDRVDNDLERVKSLLAGCVPKKSNGQILKAIREDMERHTRCGGSVVALIDLDKAHRLLDLPAHAEKREIASQLMDQCPAGFRDKLRIVLLERNTESLFEALRDRFPDYEPEYTRKAIDKDLEARDILLIKIAHERREIRDHLRSNPSLDEFLTVLESIVRPQLD